MKIIQPYYPAFILKSKIYLSSASSYSCILLLRRRARNIIIIIISTAIGINNIIIIIIPRWSTRYLNIIIILCFQYISCILKRSRNHFMLLKLYLLLLLLCVLHDKLLNRCRTTVSLLISTWVRLLLSIIDVLRGIPDDLLIIESMWVSRWTLLRSSTILLVNLLILRFSNFRHKWRSAVKGRFNE